LEPDSGGFAERTHNCGVRKRVTLGCSLHRRWPLLLMAGSGAIGFVASALALRINTTASMPIGLYREEPPRLERGAWVVFCLPEEPARLGRARGYLRQGSCPDGSQELMKAITALPGDSVALSRAGLVVNGHSISGTALRTVDRGRRTLPHAPFGESSVPPGELWVLGLDRRVSWDSRYFGPVPLDHVRAAAIPILTFGLDSPRGEAAGDPPSIDNTRSSTRGSGE
jgi:conjugative transfer signal peptidase TraF